MNSFDPNGHPLDKVAATLGLHQQQINILQQQILGTNAANQFLLELLLAASEPQKQMVAAGLEQLLAKPERLPNEYALAILREAFRVAKLPSRTTPEGRRASMHLVPPEEQPQP